MSLKSRRILFAFFVVLFIFLVPIVLLYATGHTINWRRLSLEKTGSLLIESDPSAATIFLNGEVVHQDLFNILPQQAEIKTPSRIKDLLPGEYVVRLEKYGYWPWEERFTLAPGEALNLGTIHLFNQAKPELISSFAKTIAQSSPDGSALAIFDGQKITILNTQTNQLETFVIPTAIINEVINWSGDSQRLSFGSLIIDRNKKSVDKIKQINKIEKSHWDKIDSSILYFLSGNKLFSRQMADGQEKTVQLNDSLKDYTLIDYDIYGKQIYLVVNDSKNHSFLATGLLEDKLDIMPLPDGQYKFIDSNFKKPLLQVNKKLYLIDQPLPLINKHRLLEITNRYSSGRGLNSSFIYATPLELRRWDNENQEYILTRFGSPIIKLWPLSKNAGVVAAFPDSLRLYVSNRTTLIINLTSVNRLQEIAIPIDEKNIYFVGEYQNEYGLFRLPLNEKPDA